MIHIKFRNWDKYNKRQKDIRRPYWFALSNEFFDDPELYEFSDKEKLTLIWLFCQASKQNKYGEILISEEQYSRNTVYNKQTLLSTIDKLLKSGAAADCRQDGGRDATATGQNRTEQDRTEQGDSAVSRKNQLTAVTSFPTEFVEIENSLQARGVKATLAASWLETFPDSAWIVQEVKKAKLWEESNPAKKKINFGRFITGWLTRGWDSRKIGRDNTTIDNSYLNEVFGK